MDQIENSIQQFFYSYVCIHCRKNVLTGPLFSNSHFSIIIIGKTALFEPQPFLENAARFDPVFTFRILQQ
jgi:hypothetical protein